MPDDLDIRGLVLGVESDLIALRRQLHAWPELSGAEVRTSEVIRRRLRDVGLEPQSLLLPTGLYCDIGTGPATVALRADLDALAMPDGTDTAYSSRIDGVAHACGHDVHTAILVGATLVLAEVLPAGAGVRAVFEPAEESVPGGAYDIVRGGLLDGITAIVGLHCEPKLEVGTIGLRAGAMTAAADMVSITLTGPGGHTARPELTVDLVTLLSRVAAELPRLIEEKDPLLRLVFGSIVAGEAANVIPVDGTLRGTLRTRDRSSWQGAPEIVESCLSGLV